MPAQQLTLNFASTIIPTTRPDGAYLVIPGKPVVMEEEMTVRQAAKILGYSEFHVRRLVHGRGVRQRRRGCKLFVPASLVAQLRDMRG